MLPRPFSAVGPLRAMAYSRGFPTTRFSSTKKWNDNINANAGELSTDYAFVFELQHNVKRTSTCAMLGVKAVP